MGKQNDIFSSRLLEWYDANRRVLPWREDPAPYHVWLSEIMLQQTRVEAVKKYYARFLAALPDIPSLAAAPEDLYMKLWEGLGYYSRVRNLHKGAVQVMELYGGRMPSAYRDLLKLSGIGPYTAAAIASIAFGEKVPAIDGNLMRIFARLTAYPDAVGTESAKKAAFAFFLQKMPADRPGDFNQALMDLGAMRCLPHGAPQCASCPLAAVCRARQEGEEQHYPVIPAKRPRPVEARTVFLILCGDSVAIRRRPESGLLAGLYEFPNVPGHLTREEALQYVDSLEFFPEEIEALPPAKHIFTHKEWEMTGFAVRAAETKCAAYAENGAGNLGEQTVRMCPLREIETKYAIPSAFKAYKAYLAHACFYSKCKK